MDHHHKCFVSSVILFLLVVWGPVPSAQNHYCSINRDHTLCKFQGIGPRCKTPFEIGIPQSDRNVIMSLHNRLRQMVATGNERRGRPGPQPMASNMRQMEWDDELALTAQRLADQCKYNHDCLMCRKVDRFLTGQNLYQFSENLMRDGANWEQAIMAWYDEVADFNSRTVDYFEFVKALGHYTQMAWADTYKIGCGYSYYNEGKWNRKLYICNYGPAGNVITTPMYKRGAPCSACPDGTTCSQQYPGLCTGGSSYYQPAPPPPPRVTNPPTTRRTTTTTTTTTPRPTTTTPTTTTTPAPRIVFNEIESNEIAPVENNVLSNRINRPSHKNVFNNNNHILQNQTPRQTFFVTHPFQQQPVTIRNRFFYETTTPAYRPSPTTTTPRPTTTRSNFNRFTTPRTVPTTTTRRSTTTTTTTTTTTRRPPTTTEVTTRKSVSFSPQIVSIFDKRPIVKQHNKNSKPQTAVVNRPSILVTARPQINDNRIPIPVATNTHSVNAIQKQNGFDNRIHPTFQTPNRFNINSNRPAKPQKFPVADYEPQLDILRLRDSPAFSVADSNSILLFCDFDYAKCPIRFTGDGWNYTINDTPGFGKGFATVVERDHMTNLYIRSIMYPSGEGNICLYFRFVNYRFGVDGGSARGSGLGPDGQPLNIRVTIGTLRQKPKFVDITQQSQTASDWYTARVQFHNIQSMFLLIFQVPTNVLQDNVYLAIDDILVTQGICHA